MSRLSRFIIGKVFSVLGWLLVLNFIFGSVIEAQTPSLAAPELTVDAPATGATKDPEEYNLLPVAFHGSSVDWLTDEMVRDFGYEPKCALPQWKISPQLYGEYKRYFELFPSAVLKAKGKPDNYEISLTKAKVGMLRGNEAFSFTNKISSLEGFFGASNPLLPINEPNSTGVIQNLTTLGQQCQIKMDNFAAIKKICSKLSGDAVCYMDRIIPKTTIKILDLYNKMDGAKSTYLGIMAEKNKQLEGNGELPLTVSFCDDFVETSKGNYKLFGLNQADHFKYAQAVLFAPLDIDTLYRIAFLVIAPTQNENEGSKDIFWFLQNPEDINDKYIKPPIIAAFRIPDFMTNKSLSLKPIRDSSQVTRRLLTPNEVLTAADKTDLSRRSSMAGKVIGAKNQYKTNKNSLIYCPNLNQCLPPPTPLYETIINIVNGLAKNCDGLGGYIEDAGDIYTTTGLSHTKRDYAIAYNDWGSQTAKQPFDWELTIDKDHADNGLFANGYEYSVEVNAWVVAPIGTEMDHLEGALKAFFSQDNFQAAVKNNCLADYPGVCGVTPLRYPIKPMGPERVMGFNASSTTTLFIDPEDPVICHMEKNAFGEKVEVCVPKKKRVVLTLIETRGAPGIWGAQIGWLVRKIEETVRPLDIQIDCTRTEDLFLGKCQIKPLGTNTTPGPLPSSLIKCDMSLGYDEALAQKAIASKDKFIQRLKGFYPYTKMTSEMFDYVVQYSKENGWNPALILALGDEETAWGGVGSPHWLGCMAGDPGSISDPILHAKQQMDCVFLNFTTTMSCTSFLCRYSEGVFGESCVFTLNPKFPTRIQDFYNFLVLN